MKLVGAHLLDGVMDETFADGFARDRRGFPARAPGSGARQDVGVGTPSEKEELLARVAALEDRLAEVARLRVQRMGTAFGVE